MTPGFGSLTIQKGEGITQALKRYAEANGGKAPTSASAWNDVVDRLKTIRESDDNPNNDNINITRVGDKLDDILQDDCIQEAFGLDIKNKKGTTQKETTKPTAQPEQKNAKNTAIATLSANVENADATFQEQQDNDGIIGESFNGIKEAGAWVDKHPALKYIPGVAGGAATLDALNDYVFKGTNKSNVQNVIDKEKTTVKKLKAAAEVSDAEFQKVFKQERGVDFSEENINKAQEAQEAYQQAQTYSEIQENFNDKLDSSLKQYENYKDRKMPSGGHAKQNYVKAVNNLKSNTMSALTGLYGSEEKAQQHVEQLGTQLGIDFNKPMSKEEELKAWGQIASTTSQHVNQKCDDVLGSKKVKDFKNDYMTAFKNAYGEQNAEVLSERYMKSQKVGKGVIIVGGTIAAGILTGGSSLAVQGVAVAGASLALNAAEHSTDANGYTSDEFRGDLKGAAVDGALAFGIGGGLKLAKGAMQTGKAVQGTTSAVARTSTTSSVVNVTDDVLNTTDDIVRYNGPRTSSSSAGSAGSTGAGSSSSSAGAKAGFSATSAAAEGTDDAMKATKEFFKVQKPSIQNAKKALEALGVKNPTKKSVKKLLIQYHPDKAMAKGMDPTNYTEISKMLTNILSILPA